MIVKKFLNYIPLIVILVLVESSCTRNKTSKSKWSPQSLHIEIKSKGLKTLHSKREKAINDGLLITEKDSWVKGTISGLKKSKDKKIKLRLKGDWLDHLKGDKWSFRVKVADSEKWNNLSVFSLQDPSTRSHLKEWVLHQWFKKENILTTEYDFINLKINETSKGLYVYEEHFDKSILKRYQREPGPIMKFTEDGLWEMRAARLNKKIKKTENYEHLRVNTDIKPFNEKAILKSENLSNLYIAGQQLMFDYMHGNKPLKQIFDLNLLAKYYAIVDLTRGYHGVFWHNQRFYYNPESKKLEPIGFDGYDNTGSDGLRVPFIGFNLALDTDENELLFSNIFKDLEFVEYYIKHLKKFCEKEYIDSFISFIKNDLNNRKECVQNLKKDYKFNCDYIYSNSKKIVVAIKPNSNIIQTRKVDSNIIAICNRHCTAIEIIGEAVKENKKYYLLENPIIISCTKNTHLPDFSKKLKINPKTKYLAYKVLGLDSVYFSRINPWPVPEFSVFNNKNTSNLEDADKPFHYDKKNRRIVFSGKNLIKEPLIFPEGHSVIFLEGADINLINNAYITSNSPLNFYGNTENPIKIYSSDNTSKGINIYNTDGISRINFTEFKSGSGNSLLTINKADLVVNNSVFSSNSAQNLISVNESKFSISNCLFKGSKLNGFYSLFSEGEITGCSFKNFKKNSIQLGCSLVTIKNSNVHESTNAIVVKDKDSINPTIINVGNLNFERTKQSYLLSSNTILNNI